MTQDPEAKPPAAPAPANLKKPYHAPQLREFGSLVKLTSDKPTFGGDTGSKKF